MVYAARHRARIYLVYAEYKALLVDPIYNCSVSLRLSIVGYITTASLS